MISVSLKDFEMPGPPIVPTGQSREMLHPRDVASLIRLLIVIQRASFDPSHWNEVGRLFAGLCESFDDENAVALRAVHEWISDDESLELDLSSEMVRCRLPVPRRSGDVVDVLRGIVAPAILEATRFGASRERTTSDEARLELCFEHCPQGMITFGAAGDCLFLNRAAARLLKLTIASRPPLVESRLLPRSLRAAVDAFVSGSAPSSGWITECPVEVGSERLQAFPLVVAADDNRSALLHIFLIPEAKSSDLATRLLRHARLSQQETLVARAILEGKSAATIAREMNLSTHTVRTYVERAYEKLGVANRYELMRMASSMPDHPARDDSTG
jgi:DNA-binding CsgD family transcriptional regulator/PAS domain-containing protein